jgi:hypothetical protein
MLWGEIVFLDGFPHKTYHGLDWEEKRGETSIAVSNDRVGMILLLVSWHVWRHCRHRKTKDIQINT